MMKLIMMTNFVVVIAASIGLEVAQAKELQYFNDKIDFWNEGAKVKPTLETAAPKKSEEKSDFAWKTYLDPKNKEFFKEGDYTPPEPFMEVARNPTDENIKNWFDLMAKKNELAARLESRMREYMTKSDASGSQIQNAEVTAPRRLPAKKQVQVDSSRFHVRMYFESTCPHCRRMFTVLKRLRSEQFQVEVVQIDSGPLPDDEKDLPRGHFDRADLKKHNISGVPFLLIADVKRKALLPPVQGYHDFDEVMELLRSASQGS